MKHLTIRVKTHQGDVRCFTVMGTDFGAWLAGAKTNEAVQMWADNFGLYIPFSDVSLAELVAVEDVAAGRAGAEQITTALRDGTWKPAASA